MIPVSVMVTGRGTVSHKLKGRYNKDRPPNFSTILRPIIFWNITYRCNLYCLHCYIYASPEGSPDELPPEKALEIAEQIVELKIPLVVLTGGEPLLHQRFWDISKTLADGGVKLVLSTNGTLITKDVAEKLGEYGFQYVGISLDSVNPDEHDRFRGMAGAYDRTIKGVKNSLEAGLDVGFRMTLTRYNIEEALKIIDLSKDLGVRRIAYYLIDMTGRAGEKLDLLPTHEQLKNFINRLIPRIEMDGGDPEILIVRGNFTGIYLADVLAKDREDFIKYLNLISAQGDCGRKTVSIYPNGRVKPCQFMDDIDIGDLSRQGLKEILSTENNDFMRYTQIYRFLKGEKCGSCIFNQICGGGSRGRAKAFYNDFWGDDPLCFINPQDISDRWSYTHT